MERILLTGFEPFLEYRENPSALVGESLDGTLVAGARIHAATLPVAYDRAPAALFAAMDRVRPDAVILCGLAFETDAIRLERVALNLDDTRHADNDGAVRRGRPILPGGPVGHWSTLPVDLIRDRLEAAGTPLTVSRDAGGYLCNHVFFQARQRIAGARLDIPCGFVHLPPLPDQVRDREGRAGMTLLDQVRAMTLLIETLVEAAAASPARTS